ncbi:MAG: hypothetical protein ACXVCY_15795 [Pseudobdellovibrionaceae bacterium]
MKTVLPILMMILMMARAASAGGWTSGGGENIRDERNPWWLQNTKEVTYCIKVDEQNFGQPKSLLQDKIKFALNFWKKQLRTVTWTQIDRDQNVLVGTQNFTETACQEGTDLVFQFGVLDGEQIRYLSDPTKFIGVSVRTSYDAVNLKGKGFIYISPESGPLKFNKTGLMQKPWSFGDGVLLTPALIHELGHVFGIPHHRDVHLMAEDFLESILGVRAEQWAAATWSRFEQAERQNEIFFFRYEPYNSLNLGICSTLTIKPIKVGKPKNPVPPIHSVKSSSASDAFSMSDNLSSERTQNISEDRTSILGDFFGFTLTSPDSACYGGRIYIENGKYFYEFSYTQKNKDIKLGRAELERQDDGYFGLISIWLPKSQKVFNNKWVDSETPSPIAYYKPLTHFKGEYQTYDGKISRPISIEARPLDSLTVGGILNGKYYFDVYVGF